MLGIVSIVCVVGGMVAAQRAGPNLCPPDLKGILIGLLLIGGLSMLGADLGPIAQAANY